MLQLIHNVLAWITINTKTEASLWALTLQTKLTNRYPHLNKPKGLHVNAYDDCNEYAEESGAYRPTLVNGEPIK